MYMYEAQQNVKGEGRSKKLIILSSPIARKYSPHRRFKVSKVPAILRKFIAKEAQKSVFGGCHFETILAGHLYMISFCPA